MADLFSAVPRNSPLRRLPLFTNPTLSIRPAAAPTKVVDLTQALTGAVAHELWKAAGGNEVVNWMEAERFVKALARAWAEAATTTTPTTASTPTAPPATRIETKPVRVAESVYAEGPLPYRISLDDSRRSIPAA
jgi:hypothetical protein